MTDTLQSYLRGKILTEEGMSREPTSLEIFRAEKAFLEGIEQGLIIDGKTKLEDFAIGNIPSTVNIDEINNHITEFYRPQGYNPLKRGEAVYDLGFRNGETKLGVNITYAKGMQTCLVTVFG